jgi:hypothetical protein
LAPIFHCYSTYARFRTLVMSPDSVATRIDASLSQQATFLSAEESRRYQHLAITYFIYRTSFIRFGRHIFCHVHHQEKNSRFLIFCRGKRRQPQCRYKTHTHYPFITGQKGSRIFKTVRGTCQYFIIFWYIRGWHTATEVHSHL